MTKDTTERPCCPNCGKTAPRHVQSFDNPWLYDNELDEPWHCSDEALRFSSTNRKDWDWGGAGTVTKRSRGPNGIRSVVVWDGTYRHAYGEFCSMRCAAEFANAAHQAGFRITRAAA